MGCSVLEQFGCGCGVSNEVDGSDSQVVGELDDELSDGGGGCVLDDVVSRFQVCEIVHQSPSCRGVDPEHGGLVVR